MKSKTAHKEGLSFALGTAEVTRATKSASLVYGALIAVLLFVGVAGSLFALIRPSAYVEVLACVGVVATAAFSCCLRSKRLRLPSLLLLLLFLVAWTLLLWGDISNGLNLVATQFGEVLGESFGRIYPLYEVSVAPEDYALCETLFLVPVCLLLAVLCSFLVQTASLFLTLFVTAALLVATLLLKQTPALLPSLALIIATLLIASASFGARTCYQGRFSLSSLQAYASVLLTACIVVTATVLCVNPDPYDAPAFVTRANQETHKAIDSMRYRLDTRRGMPDGDFTGLGGLNLSDEPALEVSLEQPESYWLRGYVGSSYTGLGWKRDDPKVLHSYNQLFYWLHEDGFYGQTQLADAAEVTGHVNAEESSRVMINNVGASSRNIYAPYETYWADKDLLPAEGIGDVALYSDGFTGQRSYSYRVVSNQVKQFPLLVQTFSELSDASSEQASAFLAVEGYYARFAKERYSEVDQDIRDVLDTLLVQSAANTTFNEAKQAILDVLSTEVSYNEHSAPLQATDDVVIDFLTSSKEGYSIQYASAGTLMFRYLGFPARYVEGYLITPSDIEGLQGNVTLTLDGTHAHAWTEVYLDGVGWIPVELTPPYLLVMEQADTLQGVSASSGQSEDDTTDDASTSQPDASLSGEEPTADYILTQSEFPWWIIIVGALLVLGALLAFILSRLVKRRRVLQERALLLQSDDHEMAIIALYNYGMDVLGALGVEATHVQRFALLKPSVERVAPLQANRFKRVFDLYEEAAYSHHVMSAKQRDEVADFVIDLAQVLKEHSKGLQSVRVKLVLYLL